MYIRTYFRDVLALKTQQCDSCQLNCTKKYSVLLRKAALASFQIEFTFQVFFTPAPTRTQYCLFHVICIFVFNTPSSLTSLTHIPTISTNYREIINSLDFFTGLDKRPGSCKLAHVAVIITPPVENQIEVRIKNRMRYK